ncbi:ribonuclease domain-containing protein [Pseudonocardia sp. GCM10023141]|uniref:ribonuclease domain-containing protein n=1 Tax=Pseudonocardia sp. GCM10023141 TaxID=3252653 RepID=UPI00360BDC7E
MTRRVGIAVVGVLVVLVAGFLLLARPATTAAAGPSAATGKCAVQASVVPGAAASRLPVQPLCALPKEAAQVWAQIVAGGKLRYDRDGITFANRERLLPSKASGFYREYTVTTPGESDRGARRLITGGDRGVDQQVYYTGDHYVSFVVVDVTATGR